MPTTFRMAGVVAMSAGLLLSSACSSSSDSSGPAPNTIAASPTSDAGPTTTTTAVPVIDPGDGGDYHPTIDPADFVDTIDNPYLPLAVGSRWAYEGETAHGRERVVVEVTDQHKEVMGVPAVVVRDTVHAGGQVVEDTYDWFAQDRNGNVWYLGEDTTTFENGHATGTEGSWEGGVDGALPGIAMPADPAVGDAYRQEFLAGQAEDMGEIRRTGENRSTPAGDYTEVVVTGEWTPLEPAVVEEKHYAPGVGNVASVSVAGEPDRLDLVSFTPGT